jgi:hypothetical protein
MKKRFAQSLPVMFASLFIALAADVTTDYSHTTDFGRYKTYSWIKIQAVNSLWEDRIFHDVDAQLEAKGLAKMQSGGDLGITAFGSMKNQQTLQTFYDGFGGGWYWRGFGNTATSTVENTRVGTLVVDMFDSRTKKLVWRGKASDVLSDKPDKNEKKLEKGIEDMFKRFPPKSGG